MLPFRSSFSVTITHLSNRSSWRVEIPITFCAWRVMPIPQHIQRTKQKFIQIQENSVLWSERKVIIFQFLKSTLVVFFICEQKIFLLRKTAGIARLEGLDLPGIEIGKILTVPCPSPQIE